ncbi:unnamed protein product [Schistocephalus solidus]|uniref:Bestrophin homolog n=1 Tax=Schistocephalus solidus TaxID=70667 RepID=A0A3P7DVX1_SCHSO|nr:unnamed protein product [Schistocephalus solidus]
MTEAASTSSSKFDTGSSEVAVVFVPSSAPTLKIRWKGCVLKLIYVDLIVFLVAYAVFSLVYRYALKEEQQRHFESVILYVANFQRMIPISFILGFYVQLVFNRFWEQFNSVPWVFNACIAMTAAIPGSGRGRCIRRTCIRYMNASLIIASSRLHVAARKRFPTTQHLVQAGKLLKLCNLAILCTLFFMHTGTHNSCSQINRTVSTIWAQTS